MNKMTTSAPTTTVTPKGATGTVPLGGVPTETWQETGPAREMLLTSGAELATAIPKPDKPWWRAAGSWEPTKYDILLTVQDESLHVGTVHAHGCRLQVGSLILLERDRTGSIRGPRFARITAIAEAHGVCELQVDWRRITHESLPNEEAADGPAPTIRRMARH